MPSARGELGVDALLRGDYSPEQLQADADLGKSVKEGWRNLGPADRVSRFSQDVPAAKPTCISLCPLYLAGLPRHIDLQALSHPDTSPMWACQQVICRPCHERARQLVASHSLLLL